MVKIAIINLKGGVGKSVTTINLAAELAADGWGVLVVDLDKQANTTKFYRMLDYKALGSAELLAGEENVMQCADETGEPGIALVRGCMKLLKANKEILLDTMRPQQTRLRDKLAACRDDYCLMDCPPDLDMGSINALCAADFVIIPVDCDEWAMDGLQEIVEQVAFIKQHFNHGLKIMGVLVTKYDHTAIARRLVKDLAGSGLPVFSAVIRRTVAVKNAKAAHRSLADYDGGKSTAAQDYHALACEVEKMAESGVVAAKNATGEEGGAGNDM